MSNWYDAPDRIPEGMASEPDGLTAYQIDSTKNAAWIPHGPCCTEIPCACGHKGHNCFECGMASKDPHPIYTPEQLIDTHQNKLLKWNEDCDAQVRNHLTECPGGQPMNQCGSDCWPPPVKPRVPIERIR